jgi:hypothetical protein
MTRPKTKRERFHIGDMMVFEVSSGEYGLTFALKTVVPDAKPLFSGHIDDCMAFDLRRFATRIDELRKAP